MVSFYPALVLLLTATSTLVATGVALTVRVNRRREQSGT